MPILEVKNLTIRFQILSGIVRAVNNVSFNVNHGEILGIVGESGSGKSQTALAIMALLAGNARLDGTIKFMGQDLCGLNLNRLNKIRGNKLAIIFQDPMTSLNPYLTIKTQMIEVLVLHKKMPKGEALKESIRMLDFVHIANARHCINSYPHELSGGMRQRVMIAMALLCGPELLIADEPTTALDVTVQAQILQILKELKREFSTAVILITHDMGVVASICDRVNVMYGGELMESGNLNDIFYNPLHPYTKALLSSIPSLENKVDRLATIPGEPPNLMHLPKGCLFQDRCIMVHGECRQGDIATQILHNGQTSKCNLRIDAKQ